MPEISRSQAAPLAASRCRTRRPRLYALASAVECAAISRLPKLDLAADSAALGRSRVVVVPKIEPKLRRCRPKYSPKRTAVSALMARFPRSMNSALRIFPGWTANPFFDPDRHSPIAHVIHDLYLKQLLAVFSWKKWMPAKGFEDEASRQPATHE